MWKEQKNECVNYPSSRFLIGSYEAAFCLLIFEDDRWKGLKGRRGYFRAGRAGKMGWVGGLEKWEGWGAAWGLSRWRKQGLGGVRRAQLCPGHLSNVTLKLEFEHVPAM